MDRAWDVKDIQEFEQFIFDPKTNIKTVSECVRAIKSEAFQKVYDKEWKQFNEDQQGHNFFEKDGFWAVHRLAHAEWEKDDLILVGQLVADGSGYALHRYFHDKPGLNKLETVYKSNTNTKLFSKPPHLKNIISMLKKGRSTKSIIKRFPEMKIKTCAASGQIKGHFDYLKQEKSPPQCAHCQKHDMNLQRCSRCRQVFYCNTQCQKQHWHQHKPTCTIHLHKVCDFSG